MNTAWRVKDCGLEVREVLEWVEIRHGKGVRDRIASEIERGAPIASGLLTRVLCELTSQSANERAFKLANFRFDG